MTIFPRFTGTGVPYVEETVQRYIEPTVDFDTPTKAKWVIRNSTYYEPDRIHE